MGHTVRRCVVVGLFAMAGLALSSPAFAGSGGLTSSATFDFAGGPENNDVTLAATGALLELTDTAAVPTLTSTAADLGCTVSGHTISCPAAGVSDVTIEGGAGNDRLTIDPTVGASSSVSSIVLQGNGGNDVLTNNSTVSATVDYSAAAAGVVVDLGAGVASQDGDGGQDTLSNIENVNGSALGDSITGDGNDNVINGGSGGDTLIGGGGNDLISGGNGDDFLAGNGGNDLLDGGNGVDMVDYSAAAAGVVVDLGAGVASQDGDGGQDTLSNVENVNGSSQGDSIAARDGLPEGITCGGGDDSVIADAIDVVAADCEQVAVPTPPTITAAIVGTAGLAGWYTSNVTVSWTVIAAGSTISSSTGCDPVTITTDTGPAGTTLTCTATSDGGTTTKSVTVKHDATPPTVLYAGNQGSYGILQTVAITCTATDPSPGSGIVSSNCANIQGPAYGFGAGAHTFSAVAADAAGNQGQATTIFTVIPTAADLCTLTKQFVEGSAKFQALGPKQQAAVDAIVTGACNAIAKIVVNLGPKQKAVLAALYEAGVASLRQTGWLTSAQAATLDQLGGVL